MADTIGIRIKKARERAGLSQAELAKLLGVSQQQVSNWESGRHSPNMRVAPDLYRYLNLNLEELGYKPPGGGLNSQVGDFLSTSRQYKGWSQGDLAQKLGISTGRLIDWENDRAYPSDEEVDAIARVFETTRDTVTDFVWQRMPYALQFAEESLKFLEELKARQADRKKTTTKATPEEIAIRRRIQSNPKLFRVWQALEQLPDDISDEDVDRLVGVLGALFPKKPE